MKMIKKVLPLNKKLYDKLFNLCNFTNVRFDVIYGLVFKVEDTNISYVEPHRFIIIVKDIKIILLSYDNLNLYLYDKELPITVPRVSDLISEIKDWGCENGK